jgi:hypothetical protein
VTVGPGRWCAHTRPLSRAGSYRPSPNRQAEATSADRDRRRVGADTTTGASIARSPLSLAIPTHWQPPPTTRLPRWHDLPPREITKFRHTAATTFSRRPTRAFPTSSPCSRDSVSGKQPAYPSRVSRNHRPRLWPLRLFRVVDDSMRPALGPGDGLVAVRGGGLRRGQLRVFRDPRLSSRWLVKRVGDTHCSDTGVIFEARSDNPQAANAADSHEFGWVSAAGTYRVVWTVRAKIGR